MESILAAHGQEQLIPELDQNVFQNQAGYVISREQCTTHCPSVAIQPGGVRTAKISIVDGNFIDLQSLHFSFLVRNLAANAQGGGPGKRGGPVRLGAVGGWRPSEAGGCGRMEARMWGCAKLGAVGAK